MKILLYFARRYPWQSLIALLCLLTAAALDGLGLAMLVPTMGIAISESGRAGGVPLPSGIAGAIRELFASLGLEMRLETLLMAVVVLFLVKAAILLLAKRQVGYTVAHVATDLRLSLLRALLAARWIYFTRQSVGQTANSIATEADRAARAYHNLALTTQHALVTLLVACFAFALSWKLTLAALVGGVTIWGILSILVRLSGRAGQKQTDITKSLIGSLADILQSVKFLKAMGRENRVGPLLSHDTQRLNKQLRKQVLAKESLMALQEPLVATLLVGVLYLAVAAMKLPFEEVSVLVLAFARGLNAANKTQRRYQLCVTESSALWSIRAHTEEAEAAVEDWPGSRTPSLERAIELRGVGVDYAERELLRDVDLEIPAGLITALIGGSGTGKTTLVDLVTGMTRPDRGQVLVDGVLLEDLDLHQWRCRIGYVPQDLPLLHDTIRVNVALDDPEIDDAQIERALREAGAWDFVAELEQGLDASVGERGTLLSGGQRARIALARALVHRPALLILDEATALIDPATEAELWRTLQGLRGRVTVIAISHQPALQGFADRIYRIEDRNVRREEPPLVAAGAR